MSWRLTQILFLVLALSGCILGPQEEPPAAPSNTEDPYDRGADGDEGYPDEGDDMGWDGMEGEGEVDGDADGDPDGGAESPADFFDGLQALTVPGAVHIPRPGSEELRPRSPDADANKADADEPDADGPQDDGEDPGRGEDGPGDDDNLENSDD